jgi:hypothetical protein
MDDIIEKLHLLDYQKRFCMQFRKPPLSRTYFAIKTEVEPTDIKVRYFVELCYWLMDLYYQGVEVEKTAATK